MADELEKEEGLFLDLSIPKGGDEDNIIPTEEEIAAQAAADLATQEAATAEQLRQEQEAKDLTIDDSKIFEVLSEKLGRKVESFEELSKKEEKQLNPQIQAIADWSEKTGRPVEDFLKYSKDYSTMTDTDKAREILALKYPSLNEKEINLELAKYVGDEDDIEEEVELKTLELKKLIANDFKLLENIKLELGTPVEGHNKLTEEIQADLNFATEAKKTYEDSIKNAKEYEENIAKSVQSKDGLEFNLEEGLNLKYNLTPEDKKELPEYLAEMPHWRNPDGSYNHGAIVDDTIRLKNFDKIVKMAYEQGKASGSEELLKGANNITIGGRTNEQPDGSNKGDTVEGLEKLLGGSGTRVKFGRSKK